MIIELCLAVFIGLFVSWVVALVAATHPKDIAIEDWSNGLAFNKIHNSHHESS